jgi:hypothetical protein
MNPYPLIRMTQNIHNPFVTVKLNNGTVDVRELPWPDARNLYDKLVSQSKTLFGQDGSIRLNAQSVIDAITENINLGTWLVLKATGKDEAWLNERSLSEVLDVAIEAAVLNIGVITQRLKNARSRLQTLTAGTMPQNEPLNSTNASPT